MQWNELTNLEQLETLSLESKEQKVLIFKYSTQCSLSRVAFDRLQRNWKDEEMKSVKLYFLDLLSYRQISNQIAEKFRVQHASPQVLLIQDSQAIYNASHMGIDYTAIQNITSKS